MGLEKISKITVNSAGPYFKYPPQFERNLKVFKQFPFKYTAKTIKILNMWTYSHMGPIGRHGPA